MPAEIPDDKDPAPAAVAWPTADDLDAVFDDGAGDPPAPADPPADPAAPAADPVLTDEELAALDPPADPPADPAAPPADPAAPAPVTDPAAPPVPDPTAPVAFEELPAHWQTELTKARDQAADYRVKAREYHDAFDGYNDDQRAFFLDLAKGLAGDEGAVKQSATELFRVSKAILESQGVDMSDLAVPDPNAPLTKSEYERLQQEAAQERRTADLIAEIDREVEGLGYTKGSTEQSLLLVMANERADGSVAEAHKQVEAFKQRIVSDFIKTEREKRNRHIATAPAVGGAPAPVPGEPPKTLDEAGRIFMSEGYGEVAS